ncbi:hypothetical protein VP01_1206g1 [Puccinia sorghi]|uniref:Uncharacterized protein n=1 Tax=Puccinia sorghi TaxID=27349 RepID=A0A0L6VQG7_9BASI|nr:hypothetical protein VP01_1206g1 [Puccinia sorghi]
MQKLPGSFCYCTVTVPKDLHMQTCGVWMAAWPEHAACQLQAVEQVVLQCWFLIVDLLYLIPPIMYLTAFQKYTIFKTCWLSVKNTNVFKGVDICKPVNYIMVDLSRISSSQIGCWQHGSILHIPHIAPPTSPFFSLFDERSRKFQNDQYTPQAICASHCWKSTRSSRKVIQNDHQVIYSFFLLLGFRAEEAVYLSQSACGVEKEMTSAFFLNEEALERSQDMRIYKILLLFGQGHKTSFFFHWLVILFPHPEYNKKKNLSFVCEEHVNRLPAKRSLQAQSSIFLSFVFEGIALLAQEIACSCFLYDTFFQTALKNTPTMKLHLSENLIMNE